MGLLDAFTGKPASDAANATRDYLSATRARSLSDINSGYADANSAILGGADAARGLLGSGYNTATGAVNTGAAGALSNLDAGTQAALARLGIAQDAYAPLSALAGKYGGATTLGLNALGVNGQQGTDAARAAFQASPGYDFNLTQGLEAINRRRNQGGMLDSGNADRDAQTFGAGLASNEYNSWLQNLLGFTNPELGATSGAASGIAGVNTNAANIANQGGINRANVESNRGSMLADLASRYGSNAAGLETSTGNTLADLATRGAGARAGIEQSVMQPYANTYGQEAAAKQQGSANLFNLLLNAGKLAAGGAGSSGIGAGTLGGLTGARI